MMFEIDKQKFGAFITELRKQKGFTQKELAEQLFLSDKAISKWERGLSMPDITLLVPLAELLDVTVTELLECRRIEDCKQMDTVQVELLVKKAIHFSEEEQQYNKQQKKRSAIIYFICLIVSCVEIALFFLLGLTQGQFIHDVFIWTLLGAIFGCYFSLFVPERLPNYYDENRINAYADGIFRINLTGVSFNNSNWPYLIQVGRLWSMAVLVFCPVLNFIVYYLMPQGWNQGISYLALGMILASLFVPLYVVAKKYE